MLTIRLQRTGARNKPEFRVVLAESHRSVSKKFLEVLGNYNPRNKELGIRNKERLDYWLGKNINLSPTVRNLLIEKKFLEGKKVKAWQPKRSPAADEGSSTSPTAAGPVSPAPQVAAVETSKIEPVEAVPEEAK